MILGGAEDGFGPVVCKYDVDTTKDFPHTYGCGGGQPIAPAPDNSYCG